MYGRCSSNCFMTVSTFRKNAFVSCASMHRNSVSSVHDASRKNWRLLRTSILSLLVVVVLSSSSLDNFFG